MSTDWVKWASDAEKKRQSDTRAHEKWVAKFERLLEQMRPLTPYDSRLYDAVENVSSLFNHSRFEHSRPCANPKCFKGANLGLHPGATYNFCSQRCSNAVRARKFRLNHRVVTKVSGAPPAGAPDTNVTSVPAGGKVTNITVHDGPLRKKRKRKKAAGA
jgi:hypothetical protein